MFRVEKKKILLRYIIYCLYDWLYIKFVVKYELDSNNFGKCIEIK